MACFVNRVFDPWRNKNAIVRPNYVAHTIQPRRPRTLYNVIDLFLYLMFMRRCIAFGLIA